MYVTLGDMTKECCTHAHDHAFSGDSMLVCVQKFGKSLALFDLFLKPENFGAARTMADCRRFVKFPEILDAIPTEFLEGLTGEMIKPA